MALLFFPLPSSTFSIPLKRSPEASSLRSISISRNPSAASSRKPLLSARAAMRLAEEARTADASANLDISKLGISEQIVSALSRRGITELFPIQRAVLEPAMEGRDMIGRAITGSGKTLAFGIPILDNIIRHQNHHRRKQVPSALILAPTRELARQVQREFKASAPSLSSTCLYGGIPIMNQVRALGFGMDVVVGTPGRIIDLVQRGALDLSEVKFVVLDEADQMLAIGFQEDVECILSYLPSRKQCMLFSATMPSWVNGLSRKYLKDPFVIDLVGDSDQKLAEGISLYSIATTTPNKHNLLPTLISRYAQRGKSIIFTKTKKDAESLSRSMARIIGSRPLHGNMQQFQRDKTLAAFRDGQFNVLVATDVAARGLDIPNVDLVIHFEMPNTSEIFLHRSGRTGRAGKKGTAVLIFTRSQQRAVRTIEQDLCCKFEELHGITGGVGSRIEYSDGEGSLYDEHDSVQKKYQRQDNFSGRRYGNYGRYQVSNPSFRGYESSRKNYFSGRSNSQHARQARTRRKQFLEYDDFQDDHRNERITGLESLQWPSKTTLPNGYGEAKSNSSDRTYNKRKSRSKRSFNSGSTNENFDQIVDLFKDLY
ncbi:DEAD-box ATP-dependent RNA helicase 53-like [Phoenix dactylifera]|uniref:DEAD-box ATP-dependent RNA helicase 53-like n=1 Tax=Phoenix dactylifera TaxID=42345 RepID=A0A8B7CS69_PHODC|nr:DEAD-box ATP-dependent RNA helicase 53-like [Phoenix dactylifera]XP_008805258.2 DEAD-box ATP-dependent RNA helicase 53-like [Phoenix dactylifera]